MNNFEETKNMTLLKHTTVVNSHSRILDPGFELTLRPMKYPHFYQMYQDAIKNTWTVEEVSFSTDIADLRDKLTESEKHVVNRLIAFFATGDSVVGNNCVLNLYKHVNSPEVRMYYSRQIYEEALHVQAYLTLLDNYLPDDEERFKAFAAIHNIPSVRKKAEFCFKWIDNCAVVDVLDTDEKKRQFLMNLITFAAAVEGLFFMGAFAYVYYLRGVRGVLNGLADITNWIFRDESLHMNVAFDIVDTVRHEYPDLWNDDLESQIIEMLSEAIDCEMLFAEDCLSLGIPGFTKVDMHDFLKHNADMRLIRLGMEKHFHGENRFDFMDLQDLEGVANFFERTVSQYQIGVSGEVSFDEDF